MQNVSIKKLSILGLVLMAASAVTAAIIPSKEKKDTGVGGRCFNESGNLTCTQAGFVAPRSCDVSAYATGGTQTATHGLDRNNVDNTTDQVTVGTTSDAVNAAEGC